LEAASVRAGWAISLDAAAMAGAAASARLRKARRDGEIPIGRMATRTLLEIWPESGRAVARQAACQGDI
jgi:hypothetical protein